MAMAPKVHVEGKETVRPVLSPWPLLPRASAGRRLEVRGRQEIIDLLRKLPEEETFLATTLGLIFGGAVGNAIDRVHKGTVTDFLRVYTDNPDAKIWLIERFGTNEWPSFNIADAALVIGVGMFLIHYLFLEEPEGEQSAVPAPDAIPEENPRDDLSVLFEPEPEEGERSFGGDDDRETEKGVGRGRKRDEGGQLAQDNATTTCAQRPSRIDELAFGECDRDTADDAGVGGNPENREDRDQDHHADPPDRADRKKQDQRWEREHDLGDGHDHRVDTTADVAGNDADQHTECGREHGDRCRQEQDRAGGVHRLREQVTALPIPTEPRVRAGRFVTGHFTGPDAEGGRISKRQ